MSIILLLTIVVEYDSGICGGGVISFLYIPKGVIIFLVSTKGVHVFLLGVLQVATGPPPVEIMNSPFAKYGPNLKLVIIFYCDGLNFFFQVSFLSSQKPRHFMYITYINTIAFHKNTIMVSNLTTENSGQLKMSLKFRPSQKRRFWIWPILLTFGWCLYRYKQALDLIIDMELMRVCKKWLYECACC